MKSKCGLIAFIWLIFPFLETGETGEWMTHAFIETTHKKKLSAYETQIQHQMQIDTVG